MGDVDDRGDVGLDVGVATGPERADLDDHVELGRAVVEGPSRLEDLRRRRLATVGETDDRADGDVGAGKERDGAGNIDGAHTDGRDVVLGREAAAVLDERVIELGPQ